MHTGDYTQAGVAAELKEFITSAFLFGEDSSLPSDEGSLVESGIIDSTGVLELIEFLEENFGITVAEAETVPENLGSIAGLTRYVLTKTGQAEGAA